MPALKYTSPKVIKEKAGFLIHPLGHMCGCVQVTCVPGDLRGPKRTSGPLELELWVVVSCHVGAGTQPRSSARAARVLGLSTSSFFLF